MSCFLLSVKVAFLFIFIFLCFDVTVISLFTGIVSVHSAVRAEWSDLE